ncbi:MAG: AAA family ATPase [Bacteroidales bacterium]|nr:AAA family ATPase [Bacteroidales bacterium]
MGKQIPNKQIGRMKFNPVEFEGEWKAGFGRPELSGSWLVYGGSGSGKTTFMLQLAKYLTNFSKVIYDSIEQGLTLSFQRAWERVKMIEAGNNFVLVEKENTKQDIWDRLSRRKSPNVIIIDSVNYMLNFTKREYEQLLNNFPNKLFIFVAHENNKQPMGSLANFIRYNSDIKIHVEGYRAFITTRFEDSEKGEGGKPFTIWEQGAKDYWAEV